MITGYDVITMGEEMIESNLILDVISIKFEHEAK